MQTARSRRDARRAARNGRPRYRRRRPPRRQMTDKAPMGTAIGRPRSVRTSDQAFWVIHPEFGAASDATMETLYRKSVYSF